MYANCGCKVTRTRFGFSHGARASVSRSSLAIPDPRHFLKYIITLYQALYELSLENRL
jgi:hypothetical protein